MSQPETSLQSPHSGTNYHISPDLFEGVIVNLPVDQAEILRWAYFRGKELGLSLSALARNLGVSSTTLSRVFRGVYNADIASLCDTLRKVRASKAEAVGNPDFVQTSLANRMFRVFDRVRALCTVGIIWGEMGIGKTIVTEAYKQQNNHGRTIYVRCGPKMTFAQFVVHVARSMNVTAKNTQLRAIRYKIIKLLKAGERLLIIDELHEIFLTCKGDTAVAICEFLREIYDESGCGMVLIGTEVIEHEFLRGQHKLALAQLVDRGTIQIALPNKPTKQDVAAIIKRFGLAVPDEREPEAAMIIGDILKSAGLRKLTLHLRDGAAFAAKRQERYTWGHFVTSFEDLQTMAVKR